MDLLFISLVFSLFGVVWVNKLTEPEEIFEQWPTLIQRLTSNEKVHKFTFMCASCVAGQAALWGMLIILFSSTPPLSILAFLAATWDLFSVVVITIYLTQILQHFFLYAKERA